MLSAIFQNSNTTVLGFGFTSDIAVFNKYCSNMKFLDYVPKFLEIQDFYKKVYPDFAERGGSSLATVCENMIGKKLCKNEQMSNWERRPLRFSQEHYGALDAYILTIVIEKLEQEGSKVKNKVKVTDIVKSLGEEKNRLKVDNS